MVLVLVDGLGVGAHDATSDGHVDRRRARPGPPRRRGAARPDRAAASRSARPGSGDDHLVDPLVVDRLHRGRVRVRVRDLPVRLDPLRAQRRRAPRAAAAPPRDARRLAGRSAGRRSGSSPGPPPRARGSGRAAARRAPSRWRRRARCAGPCAARRPRRRARRAGRRRAVRISSSRFRRSQPDFACGCVETISSSIALQRERRP